jgi:hypothetical protein
MKLICALSRENILVYRYQVPLTGSISDSLSWIRPRSRDYTVMGQSSRCAHSRGNSSSFAKIPKSTHEFVAYLTRYGPITQSNLFLNLHHFFGRFMYAAGIIPRALGIMFWDWPHSISYRYSIYGDVLPFSKGIIGNTRMSYKSTSK